MVCPICGSEMQPGGLITNGIGVAWYQKEEFENDSVVHRGGIGIGRTKFFSKETKISNAFYCETCNKVVGVFDIND